jgi:hypothetical protein
MALRKLLAQKAMEATWLMPGDDFLKANGIQAPVPNLPGSIGAVAREPFDARSLKRLFDLLVIFSIGDFPQSLDCSNYFNPNSPWYNVFYGAYGIRSFKPDGSAWGYGPDGSPLLDELLEVPWIDYNFLTAGALGCPTAKMCFRTESTSPGKDGRWDTAQVDVIVPSGLAHPSDAVNPDLTYYAVFGTPDDSFLVGGRQSYEPVAMRGKMHFRAVAPQITLVWGGMCPRTPEGLLLLDQITAAMKPLYP